MPKEATKRGKAGKVEKRKTKKGEFCSTSASFLSRQSFKFLANGLSDPNAPKRGLSAYMFFANEQRENVRDENPGISFGTPS
jgi:hypothetical protein